jgi:hypothetical protein
MMPFPPDPGALRLLAALRATLAAAITFFVILGLGTRICSRTYFDWLVLSEGGWT